MHFKKWQKNLQHHFLKTKKGEISYYKAKEFSSGKPLAILFHGFSGNYYGMIFLGYELTEHTNIIICDLPNHGKSGFMQINSLHELQDIGSEIIETLSQKYNTSKSPVVILTHSYSCYMIPDNLKNAKIMMICPVYEPSNSFVKTMHWSIKSKCFMFLTSTVLLAPLRLVVVQKYWTINSIKNSVENLFHSVNSLQQTWAQQKMINISFEAIKNRVKNTKVFFITGNKDIMIAKNSRESNSPQAKILKGGHILPIENPKAISEVVVDLIKTS